MATRSTPTKIPLPSDLSPVAPPTSKKLGLLSRTLFHSPEINFIFPLRIRDWNKQDVALIGEHVVHIQEIRNGTFHHIATKADFPARIRAAQVIGSTNYEPLDGDPGEFHQQHAHVLLLMLENHTLVLLTMTTDSHSRDIFVANSITMSAGQTMQCSVGKHLAVDPYSRAFAVGAAVDKIDFVRMNPRRHWAPDGSNACRGQHLLLTGMKIVKMDFLYLPHHAEDEISLLVIGYSTENNPRAFLSAQLWSIHPSDSGPPTTSTCAQDTDFCRGHGIPQILIPLRRFPRAFLLACDDKIAVYSAQPGHIKSKTSASVRELCADKADGVRHFLGSSKGAPLWKAWARPPRNDRFRDAQDQEKQYERERLYIAREDGVLCFLDVNPNLSFLWGEGATLNGTIGSAFNHDGGTGEAPDGLVFGGSLSDGGIYVAGQTSRRGNDGRSREAIMTFRQTAALYNWAPFIDITPAYIDIGTVSHGLQSRIPPETRLISTSGKLPYGAVTELRFGCEAVVRTVLEYPEGPNLTRLFAFTTSDGQPAVLLSSPAGRTWVMHGAEISYLGEAANRVAVFAEEETLAASRLDVGRDPEGSDIVFSVGPSTLSVSRIGIDVQDENIPVTRVVYIHRPGIIAGAVDGFRQRALVATTKELLLYQFREDEHVISLSGVPVALDRAPVCADLFDLGKFSYALVSDDSGCIRAFGVDSAGLHPMTGVYQLGDGPSVCCALAVVPVPGIPGQARALCGQRGGGIVVLRLYCSQASGGLSIRLLDPLDSKSTTGSVQVDICHSSTSNDGSAILFCGSRALHVTFRSGESDAPVMNRIYLTNPADTSFSPGPLRALGCNSIRSNRDTMSDQILCVDDTSVFTALLDSLPKALPLRIPLGSQPNRLAYSNEFKTCFVATVRPFRKGKRRYLVSMVLAISTASVAALSPQAVHACDPGKTITNLTLWNRCKEKEHGNIRTTHYLVVNTIDRREGRNEAGTLQILRISPAPEGLTLKTKHSELESHPITAMCTFDTHNLIYCAGRHIKRLQYTDETKGVVSTLKTFRDEGGAQYMTAQPPFVHVSTDTGSLVTFHFNTRDGDLSMVYSDDEAARSLSHAVVPVDCHNAVSEQSSSFALFSDKEGSVAGHWLGSSVTGRHVMPRAFEARLPVSMTKFVKCCIRPPWKLYMPNNSLIRQTSERHVITRDVLGTATNGSLWSFAVLDVPVWRLLKFVQHMCMRDERICPGLKSTDWAKAGHIMPRDSSRPDRYHIDGDVLSRLVERPDAELVLAEMLHTVLQMPDSGERGSRSLDFDSALAKEVCFCELVTELRESRQEAERRGQTSSTSPPAVQDLRIDDNDEGHAVRVRADVNEVVGLIRWLVEIPF